MWVDNNTGESVPDDEMTRRVNAKPDQMGVRYERHIKVVSNVTNVVVTTFDWEG